MSRSNNTDIQNPSTRWFDWSGSEGKVKYYDKEQKENFMVDLPFGFLVLDVLSTVTGFSDDHGSGIWSNEIRDIRTDTLRVRTKFGVVAQGTWEKVKTFTGAKYTQSVYIAYKSSEDDSLLIGNIKFSGSAVGPWIDFRKHNDIWTSAVAIVAAEPRKKGATNYFEPVFAVKKTTAETDEVAKMFDRDLQKYLTAYLNAQRQTAEVEAFGPDDAEQAYSGEPQTETAPIMQERVAAAGAGGFNPAQDQEDDDIPF